MDNEYGTPLTPEQPKKNNTTLIIVIVVLVILCCCCVVVGGFGWWLWTNGDAILEQMESMSRLLTTFA